VKSPERLTLKAARALTGTLTNASKMPGLASPSLPTRACRVGSILRGVKGSPCEGCYARRIESYRANVARAWEANLSKLEAALSCPESREAYVAAMVLQIEAHRAKNPESGRYYRWQVAGDLQSVAHLELVAEVARRTPEVRHWLATQQHAEVAAWTRENELPANLVVRLSMPRRNTPAVGVLPAGVASSTVADKEKLPEVPGHHCPATLPGGNGECGSCRACWERSVRHVVYRRH
jgi:hypothetical protein